MSFCNAEDVNVIYVPNKTNGLRSRSCPKYKLVGSKKIKTEDWAEFLGWYISEGHFQLRMKNGKIHSYIICLTQQKPEGVEKIKSILDRMPFKYNKFRHHFV